jgi:hypothetical protein
MIDSEKADEVPSPPAAEIGRVRWASPRSWIGATLLTPTLSPGKRGERGRS